MAIFLILAAVIIVSSIGVVVYRNPIYSALCLITSMLCLAGLFAQLNAHFLATVQIIVYAGAIMVLVVFLLMLLNLKYESPKKMRVYYSVITVLVGILFLMIILPPLEGFFSQFSSPSIDVVGDVKSMGVILYNKYVFPFEIASVLILAAMVGAVMLGKKSYGREAGSKGEK